MMNTHTYAKQIKEIEDLLGHALSTPQLKFLLHYDWLVNMKNDIVDALDCVKELNKIWPPVPTSRKQREETEPRGSSEQEINLAYCVSELMAMEARLQPEVIAFRRDYLKGRLVKMEAVEGWLTKKKKNKDLDSLGVL